MRDRKPTATEAAAAARSQIPPRPPRRRAAAAASAASKNGIFSSLNAGGGGVWMSGNRSKIVAGCVLVAGLLLLLWSWNWSTEKAHGVLTPLHAKPISELTQVCMLADFFVAILYADGLQMLWWSDCFTLLFAAFFYAEDSAQKERQTDGSRDVAFPCCIMKFICLWNPSSSSSSFFPSWNLLQFQGKHREQYYWGTYRSTLYLGIRARYVWMCLCKIFLWCNSKNNNRQRICCRVLLCSCSKVSKGGICVLTNCQEKLLRENEWERGSELQKKFLSVNCRIPKSILAGFMWLGVKDGQYALRHTCEESDKLSRYAWVCHDGATYGRQVLYILDTSFFFFSKR